MLINPFTPSEIASEPGDFFGRSEELKTLERSLMLGSVAIQGPIGIGKSSLLARARLLMEGFDSSHSAKSVIAVGDKDVQTIDQAARLLLETFVQVDEVHSKVKFSLGSVFEAEWGEILKFFAEGRHLAALKRIVEEESLDRILDGGEFLILAIDEADKCPLPLAKLIRAIVTHTQHQGVKRVRFVVSGVSPYFQYMVDEDQGISRFVYKTITVQNMSLEDATELVESKLSLVAQDAEDQGLELGIDPEVIRRVVALSGGHPHILQLLGSHLVEHEIEDPDGVIDSHDLYNSLHRVCYEDRARVYNSTIHHLEINDKIESLALLLGQVPTGFPTRIDRRIALSYIDKDSIDWLVQNNILSTQVSGYYSLVDEFLRVRLLLEESESGKSRLDIERHIIEERLSFQDDETDPRFAEHFEYKNRDTEHFEYKHPDTDEDDDEIEADDEELEEQAEDNQNKD
jgi:hypothetical protein